MNALAHLWQSAGTRVNQASESFVKSPARRRKSPVFRIKEDQQGHQCFLVHVCCGHCQDNVARSENIEAVSSLPQ
jgi:hypothetical protein